VTELAKDHAAINALVCRYADLIRHTRQPYSSQAEAGS
jgi:hypothetical protein